MINTVDKNGDGKISFSEFRCGIQCIVRSSILFLLSLQCYDGRLSVTGSRHSKEKIGRKSSRLSYRTAETIFKKIYLFLSSKEICCTLSC